VFSPKVSLFVWWFLADRLLTKVNLCWHDIVSVVSGVKNWLKIIFQSRRDYWDESRTRLLSLRRFVALSKIVQADYQPRRPRDKTAKLQLYTDFLLHGRNRSRITLS
jgi:hypothetical protein